VRRISYPQKVFHNVEKNVDKQFCLAQKTVSKKQSKKLCEKAVDRM